MVKIALIISHPVFFMVVSQAGTVAYTSTWASQANLFFAHPADGTSHSVRRPSVFLRLAPIIASGGHRQGTMPPRRWDRPLGKAIFRVPAVSPHNYKRDQPRYLLMTEPLLVGE